MPKPVRLVDTEVFVSKDAEEKAAVRLWLRSSEGSFQADLDTEQAQTLAKALKRAAFSLEEERKAKRPYVSERDYPVKADPA